MCKYIKVYIRFMKASGFVFGGIFGCLAELPALVVIGWFARTVLRGLRAGVLPGTLVFDSFALLNRRSSSAFECDLACCNGAAAAGFGVSSAGAKAASSFD